MLSGYDFSICNIPVHLNHIFFLLFVNFEVDVKVLQRFSFNIRLQEAVLRPAALWRGSNAVKMRNEFLLHTEVLMENCGKLRSEILQREKAK